MPAGEPVLGSGLGDRQLLGDDLEDSNASTRHPRTVRPPPDDPAPAIAAAASPYGLGLRDDRRNPLTLGVTYVPTHQGPITWDICPEPRHPQLHLPDDDQSPPPVADHAPVAINADVFRQRPGHWIDRVAAGESLLVSRRGKAVMRVDRPLS